MLTFIDGCLEGLETGCGGGTFLAGGGPGRGGVGPEAFTAASGLFGGRLCNGCFDSESEGGCFLAGGAESEGEFVVSDSRADVDAIVLSCGCFLGAAFGPPAGRLGALGSVGDGMTSLVIGCAPTILISGFAPLKLIIIMCSILSALYNFHAHNYVATYMYMH